MTDTEDAVIELQKAYPWAIRVARFDDDGFASTEERAAYERIRAVDLAGTSPDEAYVTLPNWAPSRSTWRDGPWMTEPDLVEWRFPMVPFPLMIVRGGMGSLCGYVGVPPSHPLHGVDRSSEDARLPGAINWTGKCGGVMVPTGEPPHFWWLGFDCGHAHQYSPAMAAGMRRFSEFAGVPPRPRELDQAYVEIEQCRRLTEALALIILHDVGPS